MPAEMGMLYTQMRYEICVQGELLQRSTVKGIVQMISDNRAKKFIMGAAAYKHYSTYCLLRLQPFVLLLLHLFLFYPSRI